MLCNTPPQSQQKHRIKHLLQQQTPHTYTKSKRTDRERPTLNDLKENKNEFFQTN